MTARRYGSTWWGRAWLTALEERGRLDARRLRRGQEYARTGMVRSLDVSPGEIRATVRGSRPRPYDVTVTMRAFTGDEWDRVLDAAAARIGHAAALLDRELPADLVDELAAAGLSLLPEAGEVAMTCSCPDEAVPCKHQAAVCYVVAELVDRDPFELLLLRGRSRPDILDGLRQRRSGTDAPAPPAAPSDDCDAAEAFARTPAPLPDLPLPPPRPGRPGPLAGAPNDVPVSPGDLHALAADAAQRAWELVTGAGDGGLSLTQDEDLSRRAGALLGTPALDRLAKRAGLPPRQLSRRAAAWLRGGRSALSIIEDTWTPDDSDVYEGVAALGGNAHVWRNQVSDASDSRQLRLGRDGLWYPFTRVGTVWELAAPPAADPREAVAAMSR